VSDLRAKSALGSYDSFTYLHETTRHVAAGGGTLRAGAPKTHILPQACAYCINAYCINRSPHIMPSGQTPILVQKFQMDILVPTKRTTTVATRTRRFSLPDDRKCNKMLLRPVPRGGPHWERSERSPDLLVGLGSYFLAERGREDKKGREGK